MKIITPAFPAMNSTHNVSHSTKRVITEELSLAAKRFADWAAAVQAEGQQSLAAWRDTLLEVLRPVDYLAFSKHFLELQVLAKSEAVSINHHSQRLAVSQGGCRAGSLSLSLRCLYFIGLLAQSLSPLSLLAGAVRVSL